MKILGLICLYFVFASASQDLEVPTENNVTKKEDKTTSLLSTPPVNDVSKPTNVLEPTTSKSLVSSTTPASNKTKPKGKVIRHRRPSHHVKPKYRHKGPKEHTRLKPRLPKRPMDLGYRRPKYHHRRVHRKPLHRVPKETKPYNRRKRTLKRYGNRYNRIRVNNNGNIS